MVHGDERARRRGDGQGRRSGATVRGDGAHGERACMSAMSAMKERMRAALWWRGASRNAHILVGRLDVTVESAVARGGRDGLHAELALDAIGVVGDVGDVDLGAVARDLEELVDSAWRKA